MLTSPTVSSLFVSSRAAADIFCWAWKPLTAASTAAAEGIPPANGDNCLCSWRFWIKAGSRWQLTVMNVTVSLLKLLLALIETVWLLFTRIYKLLNHFKLDFFIKSYSLVVIQLMLDTLGQRGHMNIFSNFKSFLKRKKTQG